MGVGSIRVWGFACALATGFVGEAYADEPASTALPGPVRVRLALGADVHAACCRRGNDGFAQLRALGLTAPYIFGHAAGELDVRVGSYVRLGVSGGVSWRSAGRKEGTSGVAPRDIRSTWRYGYADGYTTVGVGRMYGPLRLETGARLSVGGGRTTWTIDSEAASAPIVRGSAAFEVALLVRGRGAALRAGYALVRSGSMGPADLYFDYSHVFVDVGVVVAFP